MNMQDLVDNYERRQEELKALKEYDPAMYEAEVYEQRTIVPRLYLRIGICFAVICGFVLLVQVTS